MVFIEIGRNANRPLCSFEDGIECELTLWLCSKCSNISAQKAEQ